MRVFLTRALAFLMPWLLYALAIVLVDPFDRFAMGHVIPESSKAVASPVFNNALWKIAQFDRDPGENITLGSSQMNNIKPALIREVAGLDYKSLAANGSSLIDVIHLFWFAAGRTQLKRVCIGINFSNFNRATDRDLVSGALATEHNPLVYLTNRDVLAASANEVSATYLGGTLKTETPPMDREAFWREQITYGTARNFFEYRFDEDAYGKLGEIAKHCREHGIALKFAILPSHEDVHNQILAFGIENAWKGLPAKLSALAETYDFDVDDEVTRDRGRFNDPFHFDQSVARIIVQRVFASD